MKLKFWREVAIDIISDFETTIMPFFGNPDGGKLVKISPSGDETKLVDKLAEDLILSRITELGVNVVSEEVGVIDNESEYTVIVDPLDGSYNFIAGIPFFALSLAVFKKDKPIYAIIYEPMTERFFEGIPGEGAFLNGKRIKVRKTPDEKPSISFYSRGKGHEIVKHVKRTRTLGAIALELAYLAMGALDGVVDVRKYVRPTDIAAGTIIAKEAGALIKDSAGKDIDISFNATDRLDVIAVNSEELLKTILSLLE
ncbi:fructose-1,6-bisphosphatase [Pyrococcus furiosus DSM 3638]|uniref:Fructose-1,6-bisphosphatase n=3 Tax=Pyrococcus furiosus TaxID=2261 RepID=FBP_PYRFU|nr:MULTISPECIES: bifunctional fructose-bisphosphatase/inositol-phosphate phosphatase [Pyrococcus]Q8TZH9.1 RecName: Full=Fructose-1,6-bisphosphatase; Short=FBPase [Pyrococcus furiosus DSM 3638]AAL82138.1 extragenic suppressor [Pyrococcus furiosus DSM 3638]AAM48105.1 fructose-1,6-bisphosphatase [Pyrococcus furiosus DSM 3638]AFN04628.1 bifunctional inositol-1 monophosphatase/fructose-1,6-bisphosphatase [Pyrococcus furiosus COM1]MDK2869580.1 monophosphatase [Pyrococcus sp.]QEK79608.1 fructose-1,6